MNNLEEEIRKLVIHTMGTEKPKTMERSYPRWNDEDLSFDMYLTLIAILGLPPCPKPIQGWCMTS